MEFGAGENVSALISHTMFGLVRETLIDNSFAFGMAEDLRGEYNSGNEPGLLFLPSMLGVELYLWAHGRGDLLPSAILNGATQLKSETKINTTGGARSVAFPDRSLPMPGGHTTSG
jgi:hypothetical protein